MFDMSSGLLVRSGGHQKSEAEVCQELISPLLRRVAHCMSSVVAPEGWNGGPVYSSALNVETNTESRPRISGPKPHVDYMLVGHDGSDVLYRVPVEAKKVIAKNDMSQLANYMGCLGGAGDFSGTNIGVGFLMDESVFRIAFSPLSCDGLVLPVVFFSPAIKWREETTLNRGACVALFLLQKLASKRVEVTSAALSECLGQAQWLAVKEAAELKTHPHLLILVFFRTSLKWLKTLNTKLKASRQSW